MWEVIYLIYKNYYTKFNKKHFHVFVIKFKNFVKPFVVMTIYYE